MRSRLLELHERRSDTCSTVFFTQYAKNDCYLRLGSGIRADAIMDRIVHSAILNRPRFPAASFPSRGGWLDAEEDRSRG